MTRKRFKAPVISWLTKAWIGFAVGVTAIVGYVVMDNGRSRPQVALAIEGVDRLAPPVMGDNSPPERLTQPALAGNPDGPQEPDDTSFANRIATQLGGGSRLASADDGIEASTRTTGTRAMGPKTISLTDGGPGSLSQERYSPEPFSQDIGDQIPMSGSVGPSNRDMAPQEITITVDGQPARDPNVDPDSIKPVRRANTVSLASVEPSLLAKTTFGDIPAIGNDGQKPSERYARPYRKGEKPAVALIVGGLGLNRSLTERAIDDLPPEVTLAFAPYSKDLDYWTNKARAAGHEVLLELPLENGRGDQSALGPAGLLSERTAAENLQRLDWLMSRFKGYVGVTNYLGAKFSGDRDAMGPVIARLRSSGLAYFDDTGAVRRFVDPAARNIVDVDRMISPGFDGNLDATRNDLSVLERGAKERGIVLGKTYAFAGSLDTISEWAWELENRDIDLAPASAAFRMSGSGL